MAILNSQNLLAKKPENRARAGFLQSPLELIIKIIGALKNEKK